MVPGYQDKLGLPWDTACSYSSCVERRDIFGYIQVSSTIHHPEPPTPQLKFRICDGAVASYSLGGTERLLLIAKGNPVARGQS
jgi:hypothetical protein